MNWKKTLGKVGKGLGLLALGAVADVVTGGGVAAVVAPAGPWAPFILLGLQAGGSALTDWVKHRNDPKDGE